MAKSLFDRQGRLILRGLWQARRGAWWLALMIGLLALASTVGLLALSGWFITAAGLAGMVALGMAYTFNYFTPAAMIRFLAMTRTVGRYGERLASHHAALALLADLRSAMFQRLSQQKEASMLRSAKQMHRLTSDIDILNEWPLALLLPWLWVLLLLSAWWGLLGYFAPSLILPTLLPCVIATMLLPGLAMYLGVRLAKAQATLAEVRREALLTPLSAMTSLLQWGCWHDFADVFYQTDQRYHDKVLQAQRLASLMQLWQQAAFAWWVLALLYGAAKLLATGALSVALLLALLLAVLGLVEIVLPLGGKMLALGHSLAARNRLNAMLPAMKPTTTVLLPLPQKKLVLQLDQVSARLPQALKGPEQISVCLQSGEALIVQGPSGAGKTTLLQALATEVPIAAGSMTLNQHPLTDYDLTGNIGYLTQYWDLFDLTLAENLRLGQPNATDEALWQILAQVDLYDWALAQPQGLDTPLGEYGAAVSGGQARRIALARLLLKPYALLLLDEPFAGLDPKMRQRLYDGLRSHQQQGLLVLVSHHELDWGEGATLINIK